MDIKPKICKQKWQLEHHHVSNYYSSVPLISRICGKKCIFLFSLNQLRPKLHSKVYERPGNVRIGKPRKTLCWVGFQEKLWLVENCFRVLFLSQYSSVPVKRLEQSGLPLINKKLHFISKRTFKVSRKLFELLIFCVIWQPCQKQDLT